MGMNLMIGLGTMALCLFFQAALLVVAMRYYASHHSLVSSPSSWSMLVVMLSVMTILVVGNLAQLMIWAAVFQLLGEFERFGDAVYHSAVNFAALGYGDVVMSEKHRLLGPLEAINGVLMIGVSTAALMSAFQDAIRKRAQARRGADASASENSFLD